MMKIKALLDRIRIEITPYGYIRNYIIFPIQGFFRSHKLFGMNKDSEKITALKNKHQGKRCFILATGPSLCIEDVKLLENEYTIGINTIFKMFQKLNWRPTYYVMTDPNLYKSLYDKNVIDLDNFAKEACIVNALNKKIIKSEKAIQVNCCWLDHVYHYGKSSRFKYNPDLSWGVYDYYSVTQECIIYAIYMGFKEIYLLGADNNYLGKNQHFEKVDGEFNIETEQAYKMQRANDMGYAYVSEIAKEQGVRVYNATRGGNVKVFDRVELEDVLLKKRKEK